MPNFEAKTREEMNGVPKPGDDVPTADQNGLRDLGANEFYPRKWQYQHEQHTLADLQRPGYFQGEARAHLRVGDEIHFTLQGKMKLPSQWVCGVCIVEENPNTKQFPLILTGYVQYEQPTAWRGKTEAAA